MARKSKAAPPRTQVAAHLVSTAPDPVRKALLADRSFTGEFALPVARTLHFSSTLAIDAGQFVGALKKVSAGQARVKVDVRGGKPLTFNGKVGKGGSVTLRAKDVSIAEDNAGLLAAERRVRIRAVDRLLRQALIPSDRAAFWRDLVKQRALSSSEFLDFLDECRAGPEALHERLYQTRKLSLDALVPLDPAYFRTLLREPKGDQSFEGYLRDTLASERAYQLETNERIACARMAVAAISQPLIPFELLESVEVAQLETVVTREDPFSLLFVFEVAVRKTHLDASFVAIGTKVLDKLFGDEGTARARADLFSACAVLSAVGLQRIAEVRRAPLYWRRLLAFSHAGVLTDALGGDLKGAKGFKEWVFDQFGTRFFWAALAERRLAPRWWPEWVEADCLYAECVGRALIALNALPEQQRPPPWREMIERLERELADRKQYPQMFFPGPVDDFRFSQGQLDPALFNKAVDALTKGLPLDRVPGLLPFLHSARMSAQHVKFLSVSLANTPEPRNAKEMPGFVNALQAAAQAAAANRAVALADAVAERALAVYQRANRTGQEKLLCIIVDAANAMLDEHQHLSWLGERLERLAFQCGTTQQADLVSGVMRWLFHVDPRYRPYLACARAITELFRRREIQPG
jgi:hypothetical protein